MTHQPRAKAPAQSGRRYRLGLSAYDRAASLLVASVTIALVALMGLLVVFFSRETLVEYISGPIAQHDPGDLPTNAIFSTELTPPGLEEAPELDEPSLMNVAQALTLVSTKAAIPSDQSLDGLLSKGESGGPVDQREPGPPGEQGSLPNREIRFAFQEEAEYARFLDHFKIELGALAPPSRVVEYASGFSKTKPSKRTGDWAKEKRYNFTPRNEVAGMSLKLAEQAGIGGGEAILVQFYPNELAAHLIQIERSHARRAGQDPKQIRLTVFEARAAESGFEFVVVEQLYY